MHLKIQNAAIVLAVIGLAACEAPPSPPSVTLPFASTAETAPDAEEAFVPEAELEAETAAAPSEEEAVESGQDIPSPSESKNEPVIEQPLIEEQATEESAVEEPETEEPEPAPSPPPPPPELDPEEFANGRPIDLTLRLGPASFTRREGHVQTWQYRLPVCVVDFFIYPGADALEVRGWAWRHPLVGGRIDEQACRQALAQQEKVQN